MSPTDLDRKIERALEAALNLAPPTHPGEGEPRASPRRLGRKTSAPAKPKRPTAGLRA